MLEFAGFLPILLIAGMAALQLGLIGYGINQAGTAARAAARAESREQGAGTAAGLAAVSDWLSPRVDPQWGDDLTTAKVTVTIPALIPLFDDVNFDRTVTMPTDE